MIEVRGDIDMKNVRRLLTLVLVLAIAVSAVACATPAAASADTTATSSAAQTSAAATDTVTKIRVAHTQTYVPYDYVNEKGESDGFEVAVLKAVDELLPQYEFEFVPTSDDDLLIGIESGKYNVGTKGAWYTDERAKKYVFPKKNIAASIIGLTFRTENAEQIKDIDSFAKFSGKLVPIAPQNAQWAIVEDYNKNHPDNQIKLVASESFTVADAYTWVLEGRYDAYFDIKLSFEKNVKAENAPYKELADKLSYVPYKAIPTWPLFNKNDQAFADAYDGAVAQLEASGKIKELSQKYFNEDIFQYLQK
jgi:L-cystine transport system substrate-binding protein